MELKKQIYFAVLSIIGIILLGSCGYYVLFPDVRLMDCIYMTVISLTTVGYGEIIPVTGNTTAEIFTMCLILSGMGIILYGISILTATIIEGGLSGAIRRKRMLKKIGALEGHYIVCGGGRTGQPVLEELSKNRKQMVLIEKNPEIVEQCRANIKNLLHIPGDATDDNNLEAAGIKRAAGIIITLPSDKDNLYITMTARILNKTIRIISRMTDLKLEPKLYKAGADSVVSPNRIGALRLASEMIRPAVVNFLDSMLRQGKGDLRINQISIEKHSLFDGQPITALKLKKQFSLLLMGIKHKNGEIEFDPSHDKILSLGDSLIVMGRVNDVDRAVKWMAENII
jgi:voltage-gated potassium channel